MVNSLTNLNKKHQSDLPIPDNVIWRPDWIRPKESLWSIIQRFRYINALTDKEVYDIAKSTRKYEEYYDYHTGIFMHNITADFLPMFGIAPEHFDGMNNIISNHRCNDEYYFVDNKLCVCPECMKIGYHSFLHQIKAIKKCPWHENADLVRYEEYDYSIRSVSKNRKHPLYVEYDITLASFKDVDDIENPLNTNIKQLCLIESGKIDDSGLKSIGTITGTRGAILHDLPSDVTKIKIAESYEEVPGLFDKMICTFLQIQDIKRPESPFSDRSERYSQCINYDINTLQPKQIVYEIFKWSIEEQQWPSDNNLSINNLPALEYQFLNVMPTPEELTMISTVYITVNKDFGYRDRIKIEEYIRCKIFEDLLHEFYNAYLYEINKDPGYEKIDYISRIKHMPLYLLTEEPDGIFYYKSSAC